MVARPTLPKAHRTGRIFSFRDNLRAIDKVSRGPRIINSESKPRKKVNRARDKLLFGNARKNKKNQLPSCIDWNFFAGMETDQT